MPNTTSYNFADIVLVRFPFTNQNGVKQRPAVVISTATYNENKPDVILLAITSQISKLSVFGEANIQDWQAAGLLKPSVLKPVIFTAEKTIVRKTLGQLNVNDQQQLRKLIQQIVVV
ncbi:MAG TPA: type II toxin-antitoxin system PemK/MazF family toxin [Gammaproteobacteria bacterium]|nr:type II toxin-antitoxin system PemK/MazF family toxin [Gammaproteobacteria bacterium]